MTALTIKICGIKSPALVDHVAAEGADLVGFVHFAPSPRHVDLDTLVTLLATARGKIPAAVLLVDPDDALFDAVAALGPDFIQLHGHESVARLADLASRGPKLLKALPVAGPEDLAPIPAYASIVHRVLLDAKPPKDATRPGGLGTPFDWALLDALDPAIAFMLSGGLDPDNVSAAIERVRPWGLDVSSGVERTKGEKDPSLISQFIARARAAHNALEKAAS